MNSSKNNKRGGYYWNQPTPCTEEEVGRLMLENIKLLLQKKESDVDIGQGVVSTTPPSRESRHSARTDINIQALKDAGWEISMDESGRHEYNHFAFPYRDNLTEPPTDKDILTARERYEQAVRINSVNAFRYAADINRSRSGYPLSTISKERIKKKEQQGRPQQQQQQSESYAPRQASASPESPRQASAPTVPLADIQAYNKILESALEQIPSLPDIQPTEPTQQQKVKIEQIINLLTEPNLPPTFNREVIEGIKDLSNTLLRKRS